MDYHLWKKKGGGSGRGTFTATGCIGDQWGRACCTVPVIIIWRHTSSS